MKTHLLLSFLFISLSLSAQKSGNFRNIITDQQTVLYETYEFEIIELNCVTCGAYPAETAGYIIQMPALSPEANQQEKDSAKVIMETGLHNLIENKNLINGDICLQVIDGFMLTAEEMQSRYGYGNYRKMIKVNVKRFVEKYGQELTEAFPGKKIYIENLNW